MFFVMNNSGIGFGTDRETFQALSNTEDIALRFISVAAHSLSLSLSLSLSQLHVLITYTYAFLLVSTLASLALSADMTK